MPDFETFLMIYKALESTPIAAAIKNIIETTYKDNLTRTDYQGNKHPTTVEQILTNYPNINSTTLESICKKLKQHADQKLPSPLPLDSYILSGERSLVRSSESLAYNSVRHAVDSLISRRLQSPAYLNRSINILKQLEAIKLRGPVSIRRHIPVEFYARTILYRRIFGHLAPVYCVTFDQTGQFIFTGADDNLIKIWSARDGRLLSTLRGHSGEITDLSVNFENRLLASGSMDKYIRIWDLRTGKMIECLNAHAAMITSVKFAPYNRHGTDRFLISTSNDGTIVFWNYHVDDFGFSKLRKCYERNKPGAQIVCSSFSTGGSFLACGSSDNYIHIYGFHPINGPYWNDELGLHTNQVDSLQFANFGYRFISGSKDGTAVIWRYVNRKWTPIKLDMAEDLNGKISQPPQSGTFQVSMVNWSSDDRYVITSLNDHSIKIWNSNTGKLLHVLREHEHEVYIIESNPADPRIFLTGGHDGRIVLWDIERGITIKVFQNRVDSQGTASLYDCKFSPDGSMFVVTDSYGHLSLFGFGSDSPYQAIPDHMFFNYDYRGLVRDLNNFVMDEQTHMPPHMMSQYMQLVDMNGAPHPREYQYLVPDFTETDLIAPLSEHQRKSIHNMIENHSIHEDAEFIFEKKPITSEAAAAAAIANRTPTTTDESGETTEIDSDGTEFYDYQTEMRPEPRPSTSGQVRTSARIRAKYGKRKRRRYH